MGPKVNRFQGGVLAVAATHLAVAPFAVARDASSEFKVSVRLESGARMTASRIHPIGGTEGAVSFRLPGAEQFRLRLEVTEAAVQSAQISGLGQTINLGKEAVEITLPTDSHGAIRELNLTCVVKYHEGAEPRGAPLRMTLIR